MSQAGSIGSGGGGNTHDLHVAKYIVNSTAGQGGNYTTITAAVAAAASDSPATVFIMPGDTGVYAENFTLPEGVNLTAFPCDVNNPTVTIEGKITVTHSGSSSISNVRLKGNSDAALALTGGTPIVYLDGCFIEADAVAALTITVAGLIRCQNCKGNIPTGTFFNITNGGIEFYHCLMLNGANNMTPSTLSNASAINIAYSNFNCQIESSGTAPVSITNSSMILLDVECLILGATSDRNIISNSRFISGTSTSIDIGASAEVTITETAINSDSVGDAISGSGILNAGIITFTGTNSSVDGSLTVNDLVTIPASSAGSSEYFSAYLSATQSNVTGDSTLYTIPFDTAISNVGGGFNAGTGIFTAQSTGFFSFSYTVAFSTITDQTVFIPVLNGSVYSIRGNTLDATSATFGSILIFSGSWQIPMVAGDTMSVQAFAGNTTKTVSVVGNTPTSVAVATTFSGFKVA